MVHGPTVIWSMTAAVQYRNVSTRTWIIKEISGQIKELLKHQDNQCSGSMTFGCGSGPVIDLQDANQ
jgi:hypothetical protein